MHGDRHDWATPEVVAASHIELQEATEEMSRGVAFFWKHRRPRLSVLNLRSSDQEESYEWD